MKIGFALPNIGPLGSAQAISKVAGRAEALGYDSLWTIERLLWPVKPQTPYPATPDGLLPELYKYSLDPLDTLTFAAAHTGTVALGTSVPGDDPLRSDADDRLIIGEHSRCVLGIFRS